MLGKVQRLCMTISDLCLHRFGSDPSRRPRHMSALPKPWEMDAQFWKHCRSSPIGRTPRRIAGRSRAGQPQRRVPAVANAAGCAALKGSADCPSKTSSSEIASTACLLGQHCGTNALRVKQSLLSHHPALISDKHLPTGEMCTLVCQAPFHSRLSVLVRTRNMAGTKGLAPPCCPNPSQVSGGKNQFLDLRPETGVKERPRTTAKDQKEEPDEPNTSLSESWVFAPRRSASCAAKRLDD